MKLAADPGSNIKDLMKVVQEIQSLLPDVGEKQKAVPFMTKER